MLVNHFTNEIDAFQQDFEACVPHAYKLYCFVETYLCLGSLQKSQTPKILRAGTEPMFDSTFL